MRPRIQRQPRATDLREELLPQTHRHLPLPAAIHERTEISRSSVALSIFSSTRGKKTVSHLSVKVHECQCRASATQAARGVVPGCDSLPAVRKAAFSASSALIRRLDGSASPSHSPFSALSSAKYFPDSFLLETMGSLTLSPQHLLTCGKRSCRKRTVLCRCPSHTRKNCGLEQRTARRLFASARGKRAVSPLFLNDA